MRARSTIIALAAGCSFPGTGAGVADGPPPIDGGVDATVDAMVDAIGTPAWGPATLIGLPGAEPADDDPSLTEDELELFFNAIRGAPSADIWVAKRTATTDSWASSTATRVANLSTTAAETTPEVSPDGLTIYFGSARSGGDGMMDIYMSTRANRMANWQTPTFVAELSTAADDSNGSTADGLTIAFTSSVSGDSDVFLATRPTTADPWSSVTEATAVNSAVHEGSVVLSVDRHWIYFDTQRDGPLDLYAAYRSDVTAAFPAAFPVPGVNSAMADADPWISPDGRHLVFRSTRGGTAQLWEARR